LLTARALTIRPAEGGSLCDAFGVDLPWSAARWTLGPRGSRAGRHETECDGSEQRILWATRWQLDADPRDVLDYFRHATIAERPLPFWPIGLIKDSVEVQSVVASVQCHPSPVVLLAPACALAPQKSSKNLHCGHLLPQSMR
jgi:hypothetical protein